MHPQLQKEDIRTFAQRYRNTKDEEEDLLDFYEDNEGDLTHILEEIICSENEDTHRFVKFFEEQIKAGVISKTKLFEKSKKNIRMLPDERAEAKKEKKKLKEEKEKKGNATSGGSMEDL